MLGRHQAVALALGLAACAAGPERAEHHLPAGVQTYGALRTILHQGRTEAVVSLAEVLPDARLYAVGALEGLAGEITVAGGEAWLSRPEGAAGTRTETATRPEAAATLLVAADVPAWQGLTLERDLPFDELDEGIASLAAAAGLALDQRIPFLVEGELRDLDWHVIDGSRLPAGPTTHEDHQAAAVRETAERVRATLVGFYSASDAGVFTHMGSRTHVHCILRDRPASGHVDGVILPAGTVVRFPALPW